MTEILKTGDSGSVGNLNATQKEFREQINAINDAVRQRVGLATVNPGDTVVNDPLNAPFILYVNSATGEDTFVGGEYARKDDGSEDQKLKRISQQRLVCGYTEARPFKTINRAVIEAGIITCKDYLTGTAKEKARVTIMVQPSEHLALNGLGSTAANLNQTWTNGFVPTNAQLQEFNPNQYGGILLVRGLSLVSLDLRKTIIRPSYVPMAAAEAANLNNIATIFRTTGEGYYYGMTFMDNPSRTESHHLLTCFQAASKSELDEFYAKISKTFKTAAGLSDANLVTNDEEHIIVGPKPTNPSPAVDTTASASPYIYNCSIRSAYGLCGGLLDGDRVGGFKSWVMAQFTGVSLNKDPQVWEIYNRVTKAWEVCTDYEDTITTNPNDVRPRIGWRSFHIRAVNEAVIQEVSVFAIGQAVHHWTQSAGEITITNSNSNFGGVAALAEGFRDKAFPQDTNYVIQGYRVPLNPLVKRGAERVIFLGLLTADHKSDGDVKELVMQNGLTPSLVDTLVPNELFKLGFSLKEDDYIWVENASGSDYRAKLKLNPWDYQNPEKIQLKEALKTDNKDKNRSPSAYKPDPEDVDSQVSPIGGARVYIRRFTDVRSFDEREFSLLCGADREKRGPIRDYVPQPIGATWTGKHTQVVNVQPVPNGLANLRQYKVILNHCGEGATSARFDKTRWYQPGDVVIQDNKHWQSQGRSYQKDFSEQLWTECYVHTANDYTPPGRYESLAPVIIFDKDLDEAFGSQLMGNKLNDADVQAQIKSGVDRIALQMFMENINETDIETKLTPSDTVRNRQVNIGSAPDSRFEWRRPTNMRLFGHAYEWPGFHNYSKALPDYQQQLSAANKFTYYFTNIGGGKVYASGFNEEGFAVSPRGIEDITTGDVKSPVDLGSEQASDSLNIFKNLKVTDTLDITGAKVIGGPQSQTKGQAQDEQTARGFVRLADASEIANPLIAADNLDFGSATEEEVNDAIDDQPWALTPIGLEYWAWYNNILKGYKGNGGAIVIHVGSGVNTQYDACSIPFGWEVSKDWYWTKTGNKYQKELYLSVTDALKAAGSFYIPAGAELIISVHDDITRGGKLHEEGPLIFMNNAEARYVVAGARGGPKDINDVNRPRIKIIEAACIKSSPTGDCVDGNKTYGGVCE